MSAVERQLGLNRKTVAVLMQRAVTRGLARRQAVDLTTLCVDATLFKRRHAYVTVSIDPERGSVIDVTEGMTAESLSTFYRGMTPSQRRSVKRVNMDMSPAFISATRLWIEDAVSKICFDKFHVKKLILHALDNVRNAEYVSQAGKLALAAVRDNVNRTARAWSIKETASDMWSYAFRTWAIKGWKLWIRWDDYQNWNRSSLSQ